MERAVLSAKEHSDILGESDDEDEFWGFENEELEPDIEVDMQSSDDGSDSDDEASSENQESMHQHGQQL